MKRGKNDRESARGLARIASAPAEKAFPIIDALTDLWFRSSRDMLPRVEIIEERGKKVRQSFGVFSAKLEREAESFP
jgi:hypothetical protein